MSPERYEPATPAIAEALAALEDLIRGRYPGAAFTVFEGEDPEGVYLRATVEREDPDEVVDTVIDALYRIQVEQELPVYVIPVEPLERAAAQLRERRSHRSPVPFRLVIG